MRQNPAQSREGFKGVADEMVSAVPEKSKAAKIIRKSVGRAEKAADAAKKSSY